MLILLFGELLEDTSNHMECFLGQVSNFRVYRDLWQYSPINTTLPALSAIVPKEAFSLFYLSVNARRSPGKIV